MRVIFISFPSKILRSLLIVAFTLGADAQAQVSWQSCVGMVANLFNKYQTKLSLDEIAILNKLDLARPTLIVVDGLSSGADYPIRARELFPKINLLHIQSSPTLPRGLASGFQKENYSGSIVFRKGILNELAVKLGPLKMAGLRVVAGSETDGIQVRAQLTNAMDLPGSSLELAEARTNKFLMAQAVSPYVRTIPGQNFDNVSDAWDWIQEQKLQFPLFIKPVQAAGSFGAQQVQNKIELFDSFKKLIGKRSPLGKKVKKILVQPALSREVYEEFEFDVVFNDEGLFLTNITHYEKKVTENGVIYLSTKIVREKELQSLLPSFTEAAKGVAKGLQVTDGVLHIEVFVRQVDGQKEVTFIEAGERPAGGRIPQFIRNAGGKDMITMHLYSMFDRTQFRKLAVSPGQTLKDGIQIDLQGPPKAGIILSLPSEDEMRSRIPGYSRRTLHVQPGDLAGPSVNLFQDTGIIEVIGSKEEVDQGLKALREWEASDFYKTREPKLHERLLKK